jgi:hypothetical protein
MKLRIDRYLKPDLYVSNLDGVDFAGLSGLGYRLILLDVDNTLSRHGGYRADHYARQAVRRIRAAGLQCWLISNAGRKRIERFAASLDLPFVAWAKKPSVRGLLLACQACGCEPRQAVMVGDQILTDVISAHRAGCLAVLVRPRDRHEALNVRIKRLFERIFYRRYRLDR